MELRQLRYFVVAGEEQHISRAAQRLHVSQPALSQQIRDLESELGFALFDRLPRGVRLSVAGSAFLERVRTILADLADATERSRHAGRGEIGRLRIGFNEIAGRQASVGEAIRAFREQYPHVELDMAEMNTFQQLEAFRAGQIDIGFQYNQGQELDSVRCHPLRTDRYCVALPDFHHLAGKNRLTASDLSDEPLIMTSRSVNPLIHSRIMAFFHEQGISPRIVQEAGSVGSVMNLVSVGMGLGLVVDVHGASNPDNVVMRPLSGLKLPLNFVLAWRAADPSPLVANFVRSVADRSKGGRPRGT